MLKQPVDIEDWKKINQYTCWFAENEMHVSGDIARAIESKFSYSAESIHDSIKRMFLGFAEVHFGCVQLLEGQQDDYVITPIVDPHAFAGYLQMPVANLKGPRPGIGEAVTFAVWDGNNAPADLGDWTGTIIERRHNGFFTEYIIVRNADQQKIKLARKYILRRANSKDKTIKAWSFEDYFLAH